MRHLKAFLLTWLGLVMVGSLLLAAAPEEVRGTEPPGKPSEPALVARDPGGDRIELYDEDKKWAPCRYERRAVYVYRDPLPEKPERAGMRLEGCFFPILHPRGPAVVMHFEDDDTIIVLMEEFAPPAEAKAKDPRNT